MEESMKQRINVGCMDYMQERCFPGVEDYRALIKSLLPAGCYLISS